MTGWNPWANEYGELFTDWLRAGAISGTLGKSFNYDDLIPVIDKAEELDLLGDLDREQAILLLGLWMGRYQGNQDTGWWTPRVFPGNALESAKQCAQEFIAAADVGDKEFWTAFARLHTALNNLHPENQL